METKNLDDLKENPKNPRRIDKHDFNLLVETMKEYGDLSGIVFNRRTGQLVGGHQRKQAFNKMGGQKNVIITENFEVPNKQGTVALGYVNVDNEQFAYREVDWDAGREASANIAANRIQGQFDLDLLAQVNYEISQLDDGDELLKLSGQTDDEVSRLLDMVGANGEDDKSDEVPPPDISNPASSKPGEIYQLGNHRLMCGDSTDFGSISDLMNGQLVQLILTSPPYGVGMEYEEETPDYEKTKKLVTEVFNNSKSVVKDDGFAFVNFGERFSFPQMMGQLYRDIFSDWNFYDMRYWKRSSVGMAVWNTTQPRCMSDMESLFTWQNGKKSYPVHNLEISKQSLWQADGSSAGQDHPAVMAVGIADNAVKIYSVRGDSIFDPFGGAGTTLISCEKLGRKCYMMEIDPKYCDVIRKRYAKFIGKENTWQQETPVINKTETQDATPATQ